ncbi:NADP-dependent phosphogluconate dehydrogenase [Hydrobacter penzbergensis]|nr:NADP-dependent phosphogluconate dehydrogenase [Hydrobacter penzbergensis]
MSYSRHVAFIIMGVSGVGKTTIGKLLSQKTHIPFFDADDFHSEENIAKMRSGEALTDEDRSDWLHKLNTMLVKQLQQDSCILACSALKQSYRDTLSANCTSQIKFIHLFGSFEKISAQMKSRKDHFISPSLLQSQFDALENPVNAIHISIDQNTAVMVEAIHHQLFNKSEIGIIGLGVMGKSLCRNFAGHGFNISMYNRHLQGVEENVAVHFQQQYPELNKALPFDNIESFINSLQTPRKIIIMVNAGAATDDVIQKITPYLSAGDVVVDGGNTYFEDTERRQAAFSLQDVFFIGCGISGGEEGALMGPSLMPGGNKAGYEMVQPYLEAIAAKDHQQNPCCTYISEGGSGHFVKMIHNGIEYVEMQLLSEVYQVLRQNGKNPDAIAAVFEAWKKEGVDSYLLDITIDILKEKEGDKWLLDQIVDEAQSKGTGNWAAIEITKQHVPATLIATSLYARYESAYKDLRVALNALYPVLHNAESPIAVELLREAYELARIINHFQGFWVITEAFKNHGWQTNMSEIARIWTNGCIIRSDLMQELITVFNTTDNMLLSDLLHQRIGQLKPSLSKAVSYAIENEIAVPCLSEAINAFNAITTAQSPANLLQAQRDYFGAHTFQRYDTPGGKFFHHQWKKS